MELRRRALDALCEADATRKVEAVQLLRADADRMVCDIDGCIEAPERVPGRPARPERVDASRLSPRSAATRAGHQALIHSIVHIEFNAINLALDAVWRFAGMPRDYYLDWLRVADEEALHFSLLREHLATLGAAYGDFPAHDGLWSMAEATRGDPLARMGLVPRLLEARGLDANPQVQDKLRRVGDARAVEILDLILRDEVGHVAVGNRWFHWLCRRDCVDPVRHFRALLAQHDAPRPRPPFNLAARAAAGFSDDEIADLLAPT